MDPNRPLTPRMKEILMECHEREILKLEPFDAAVLPGATGLVCRGMVGTKRYKTKTGKTIIACYVTNLGLSYLTGLTEN